MNSSFSFFFTGDSLFARKVSMLQKIREILTRRYMFSGEEGQSAPTRTMPRQQRTLFKRLLRRFESAQSAEIDWVAQQKLSSSQ